MSDAPPAWPPFYDHGGWFRLGSDEPQFRPKGRFGFEFIDPGGGDDPALAAAWYAEDLARAVACEARWTVAGGWEIAPGAVSQAGGTHATAFAALHPASGRSVEGRVALTPDPSHWVKVEVFLGAFRVFVAYLDKPWEECELWPAGAVEKADEAPGRVGKRRTWVTLSAAAWPVLECVAGQGWFNIEHPDL